MNRDELNVIISNAVNKFLDENSENHLDDLDISSRIKVEDDRSGETLGYNDLSIEIRYNQK